MWAWGCGLSGARIRCVPWARACVGSVLLLACPALVRVGAIVVPASLLQFDHVSLSGGRRVRKKMNARTADDAVATEPSKWDLYLARGKYVQVRAVDGACSVLARGCSDVGAYRVCLVRVGLWARVPR